MFYTPGQSISFIESVLGPGSLSGDRDNISVVCPYCREEKGQSYRKRKCAIKTDSLVFHCWVCGEKGHLYRIIQRFHPEKVKPFLEQFGNSSILRIRHEDTGEERLRLPEGCKILALHTKSFQRTVRYLTTRGVPESDFWYWKFLVNDQDSSFWNRVIIPSFDIYGDLNYWTARKTKGKGFKYKNPPIDRKTIIFNEINLDFKKELLITEGPFDLLKCPTNSTCLLGSELDEEYLLFQRIVEEKTPVILALDPDARIKQNKIAALLHSYGCEVKTLDLKSGDLGELRKSEVQRILSTVRPYSREDSLSERIGNIV